MYDLGSDVIAGILLITMSVAMLAGVKIGQRAVLKQKEEYKSHTLAVQGSLLGLLALLLGFSFSLSLSRFDDRSQAVVDEANAISTAWLRADLMANPARDSARSLFARYADLRVRAGLVAATEDGTRESLIEQAEAIFAELWVLAVENARELPGPISLSVVTALNDMSDALSSRNSEIERHVPELVLYLLFTTFVMLGGLVGYSASISGIAPGMPAYALLAMIVVLVFLVIDLDRPRRGLVKIDQAPMNVTASNISNALN